MFLFSLTSSHLIEFCVDTVIKLEGIQQKEAMSLEIIIGTQAYNKTLTDNTCYR